jgi:quercetin dioxygenase-like cupin family protein
MKKKIPMFMNEDEEREFRSSRSAAEYIDWKRAKRVILSNLNPSVKAEKIKLIVPVLFLLIIFGSVGAFASDYEGVKVTVIKKATTAANGQKLAYARTDKPEVTVAMVEIPPAGDTGWHSHQIPVYAYILSGAIAVELEDGKQYEFKEGEAIIEVINTPHIGRNRGKAPVKLVVFYTGAEGGQNTVKVVK